MRSTLRLLDPELCELARTNCNEDPDLIASFICALNKWFKKCPHLKARSSEQLLVAFLRRCRYSLEDSKKRIDAYFAMKGVFPEVLRERMLSASLLSLYGKGVHIIPSKPMRPNGPRIIISQFAKYDPKAFHPHHIFKLFFMLLEMLAIEDDNATIAGLIYVIDARDVSMEQMLQFDPCLVNKIWMFVEHCLPMKFNEIHLINMRREGLPIYNFVTSFLPKKLPMKLVVHKKAEDLYAHLPRDAMTVEYGGHNGYQFEALDAWQQKLLQYTNYFAEDAGYGTNEKLRVGLNSSWEIGQLSGMFGSFRKLQED